MRSRTRVVALISAVLLLLGCTAAVAIPVPNPDPCDAAYKSNTIANLRAYDDCRFDRIEQGIPGNQTVTVTPAPVTVTAPPVTSTVTVTASASPTPTPTQPTSASPTSTSASPTSTSPTSTTTPPASTTKPGPTNTGVPAGTVLTPYTGPLTITTAGTVIDSKDVTGALIIRAKDVVIKNSKIHGDLGAVAGINVQDNGSATITDTEIYDFQVGIVYANWTATRINMHDITFDGIKMSSNATLQDSWIHDPKPTSDAHWDGVQVQNGVVNTVIRNNVIDAGDQKAVDTNSALFLVPDLGAGTDGPLTVTGNWLNGGNYTVYILDGRDGQTIKNITFTGNRFGRSSKYGPAYVNVPVTWTDNVWDDNNQTITR